nr:hypothetical protein [Tanacetum cinerariifolium]
MSTMIENFITTRADNCPPMLEKSQYNSWQSHILIYIRVKEHAPDVYTLVNHLTVAKEIWDRFKLLIKECDEAPSASAVLMAKILAYDSDVLFKVRKYDTYQDNNVINQSLQEMEYYEQAGSVNDSNIDMTSDNTVISYDQYMKETESEVVQDTTSSEQQDAMIMYVTEEMSNHVAKCNAVNKENKTVKKSLTAELERLMLMYS